MNVQTSENGRRDSHIFVGFTIDCVRKEWQNTVGVPGPFAKTGAFKVRRLGLSEKTNLRPARVASSEARTTTHGARHG